MLNFFVASFSLHLKAICLHQI